MADEDKAATAQVAEESVVNSHGEVFIDLDARYGLRPDFEAIEQLERELKPLRALYSDAQAMEMSLADTGRAVAALMRGYGRAHPDDEAIEAYRLAKPDRLARLIYESGVPKVQLRLAVLFMGALTGGYDASGEAKTPVLTGTRAGE